MILGFIKGGLLLFLLVLLSMIGLFLLIFLLGIVYLCLNKLFNKIWSRFLEEKE